MTFRDIDRLLKKDGWYVVSVEGSHYHYRHPTKKGKVQVPNHRKPKDIWKGTVNSILKQAGLK